MSWKGSIRYWSLGPFDYHCYVHALDPKQRRFHSVGAWKRTWQVWPPRSVLNPDNEFTLSDRATLLQQIEHCLRLLRNQ